MSDCACQLSADSPMCTGTILDVLQQLSGDENASVEDMGDSYALDWEGDLDDVIDELADELESYGYLAVLVD